MQTKMNPEQFQSAGVQMLNELVTGKVSFESPKQFVRQGRKLSKLAYYLNGNMNDLDDKNKPQSDFNKFKEMSFSYHEWNVSFSSFGMIENNKRHFTFQIAAVDSGAILETITCYGKPYGKLAVLYLLQTMVYPTLVQNKYGKPKSLYIAYRLHYCYDLISTQMSKLGIKCELETEADAIKVSRKENTNPYGWNHLGLEDQ